MVGDFLPYVAGAGMAGWIIWAVGAALYGYFADEVKEAHRHGESTKSGILSGANGLVTCLVMGILIVIALVIIVGVGSFIWETIFTQSTGPVSGEYAM